MPPVLLLGYVLKNVPIQTWDQSPPPPTPRETHVQLPILRSNQGGNLSSLHEHVYTRECKKTRVHTHTNTDISVCLKDRDGESVSLFQQMATMPWAKSKYGQQTDNCCQSRERWDARGPNLLPPSILSKWEARIMKMEENCIHLIPYILWQYCVGMCPQPATAKQSSIH